MRIFLVFSVLISLCAYSYCLRTSTKRFLPIHSKHQSLQAVEVVDLSDSEGSNEVEVAPSTHGYEGDFKVGDIVRVNINTKFYHVKAYAKSGFDPHGMIGQVDSLALYGRKLKQLCSAITPVKVKFSPEHPSTKGMFEKAWIGHFAGEELELIERPVL
jgi:hypothetical protein